MGVDPEAALRAANAKFTARFHRIEAALAESGQSARDASLPELDRLWEEAKCKRSAGHRHPGTATADSRREE